MIDAPLEGGPTATVRRRLLGALAGLALIAPAGRKGHAAVAQTLTGHAVPPANPAGPFPTDILAVIAGQRGGATDVWARSILSALTQNLPPGTTIRGEPAGAADGVTGANQFETRTAPDGARLMVAPGAAALAWLAGDPRARFDVGHWVAVLAGAHSAVVAVRGGRAALVPGRKIRVAAATPNGPELAALLGVDLLGAQPVPVTGLMDEAAVHAAFADGSVDAVLLRGTRLAEQQAVMAAIGVLPVFGLGMLTEAGTIVRDPRFPDLPELSELLRQTRPQAASGRLFDSWGAVAAAARLEFALVLPQLTPAAMVALWRRVGSDAAASPEMARALAEQKVRALGGAAGAVEIAAISVEAGTLLELRRWLGARLGWHPG